MIVLKHNSVGNSYTEQNNSKNKIPMLWFSLDLFCNSYHHLPLLLINITKFINAQDGPTPPPNQCAMATTEVFLSEDVCTTSWRQLLAGDEAIPTILRTPGCSERLLNYVMDCEIFPSEVCIILAKKKMCQIKIAAKILLSSLQYIAFC